MSEKNKHKDKEIIDYCLGAIERIKKDEDTLISNRLKANKYYNGGIDYKDVVGRSKVVVTTMQDTINWVIPELLKIFASGDEVILLKARREKFVEAVKKLNEKINYYMRVRNNWFILINDVLNEACISKLGLIKYYWHDKDKIIEMPPYQGLSEIEYKAKSSEIEQQQNENYKTEIVDVRETIVSPESSDEITGIVSPAVKTYDLTIRHIMPNVYPKLECVPSEDVGFDIDARDADSIPFFYHTIRLRKYEIIEKYGEEVFEKIENSMDERGKDNKGILSSVGNAISGMLSSDSIKQEKLKDLGGNSFMFDKEDGIYYFYECYYKDKDDGTPKFIVICGDVLAIDERNIYDKATFEFFTPHKLPNRLIGLSFYDLLHQMQDHLSMLVRQINDNIAFNNNGRSLFDGTRVDRDELENNNYPGANVECKGTTEGVVKPLVPPPLQPLAFSMLEFVFKQVEYHSGISRAWQGVDPNVINPTFRGFAQQVRQAAQRIEMMARLFAEMTIAPLTKDVIDMDIKFGKKNNSNRLLGDSIEISPDNLIGEYDIIVNVGIGTGNKDVTIMQMQQAIGLDLQLMKAGVSIVTAQNIYEKLKELYKAMGYRNVDAYVTDPKIGDVMKNLIMMFDQHLKQMAMKGIEMENQGMNAQMMIPDQNLIMAIQQAKSMFGGGEGMKPMPNQIMPENPMTESQAMNPTTTMDGGQGFYG